MEILIAGKNPQILSALKEKLGPVVAGISVIDSIDALQKSLNRQTPLLLVTEDFIETTFSLLGSDFLEHTPCVALIENSEVIPEILVEYPSVDIIQQDAPRSYFLHKLAFHQRIKSQLDTLIDLSGKLEMTRQSMQDHIQTMDSLSVRDGLTGLYNRRHFPKICNQMFSDAKAKNEDFSLLLIDIDYFSQINKQCGQQFGDQILNELSARLTALFRPEDATFRFGGEDFCVLLPRTSVELATDMANTFLSACSEKPFTDGQITRSLTVSIGLASLRTCSPRSPDELITMAEMALFTAKAEGRNRVLDYHNTVNYQIRDSQRNFLALKNNLSKMLDKTKSSTISSLQLLARDLGDSQGQKHVVDVSQFITHLCNNLRLPDTITRTFANAIALHSSIRSLLYEEIISKSSSLNDVEKEIIQEFPYRLLEFTELFDYFSSERAILLSYGERFDGKGYPDGLHGDQIPLGARIFNLADAFVAMNSDRPYRPKLSAEQIISELKSGAGKQFDPFLVNKTFDLIASHNLLVIDQKYLADAKSELLSLFSELS